MIFGSDSVIVNGEKMGEASANERQIGRRQIAIVQRVDTIKLPHKSPVYLFLDGSCNEDNSIEGF